MTNKYYINDLHLGKSYCPVPFPLAKVTVTQKTQTGITLLRLSPLPVKSLYFDFKDFNTGASGAGPEGVLFIEISE